MNLRETIKRILKEEYTDTKFDIQAKLLRKLLRSKNYEGVCGYTISVDYDNEDRVGSVIIRFAEEWYRSSDEVRDLNRKLSTMTETKMVVKNIAKKFLGIENIYVGSSVVKCNSSLNEETTPKDLAFQKALKRVIPDGSVYKSDYPLPYSDEGDVHIIMKYSVLPSSRIMKMTREDGSLYDAIQVHLQIDELLWKSDFDKEWERVEKTHSLPSSFWSMFEDDIADLVHKKMGLGYVEVYYKYPPIH